MRKSNHSIHLDKPLDSDRKQVLESACIHKLDEFFQNGVNPIIRNKTNHYLRNVSKEVLLFLIANTNDSLFIDVSAKAIRANVGISEHHCKKLLNILKRAEIIERIGKRGFIYHDNLLLNFKKY